MANAKRPARSTPAQLNILGASVRAAAFSALRAGLEPVACDLFGDVDLRAVARFVELRGEYPEGFEGSLRRMADAPFVYTGGLENHPDLVDRLAKMRSLLGNDGAVLRRARDPVLLAEVARESGASPPEVRRGEDPPQNVRGWLLKPLAGAGGRGIQPASTAKPRDPSVWYFQRRVRGTSCSSLHLASRSGCSFLGATRQLVGARWLHARPYAWCGSVGPVELPTGAEASLRAFAEAAAFACGLRGVFGVDFLLDGEKVRPVEINPRYTASAEILEHARCFSAIALHAAAFLGGSAAAIRQDPQRGEVLGKAVVFASRDLIASSDLATAHWPDPARFPELADIPACGSIIKKRQPIITVFAKGASVAACVAALKDAAKNVSGRFRPA